MRLAGRRAVVVGLGKSGLAAARLLATNGVRVSVADDKDELSYFNTGIDMGSISMRSFVLG